MKSIQQQDGDDSSCEYLNVARKPQHDDDDDSVDSTRPPRTIFPRRDDNDGPRDWCGNASSMDDNDDQRKLPASCCTPTSRTTTPRRAAAVRVTPEENIGGAYKDARRPESSRDLPSVTPDSSIASDPRSRMFDHLQPVSANKTTMRASNKPTNNSESGEASGPQMRRALFNDTNESSAKEARSRSKQASPSRTKKRPLSDFERMYPEFCDMMDDDEEQDQRQQPASACTPATRNTAPRARVSPPYEQNAGACKAHTLASNLPNVTPNSTITLSRAASNTCDDASGPRRTLFFNDASGIIVKQANAKRGRSEYVAASHNTKKRPLSDFERMYPEFVDVLDRPAKEKRYDPPPRRNDPPPRRTGLDRINEKKRSAACPKNMGLDRTNKKRQKAACPKNMRNGNGAIESQQDGAAQRDDTIEIIDLVESDEDEIAAVVGSKRSRDGPKVTKPKESANRSGSKESGPTNLCESDSDASVEAFATNFSDKSMSESPVESSPSVESYDSDSDEFEEMRQESKTKRDAQPIHSSDSESTDCESDVESQRVTPVIKSRKQRPSPSEKLQRKRDRELQREQRRQEKEEQKLNRHKAMQHRGHYSKHEVCVLLHPELGHRLKGALDKFHSSKKTSSFPIVQLHTGLDVRVVQFVHRKYLDGGAATIEAALAKGDMANMQVLRHIAIVFTNLDEFLMLLTNDDDEFPTLAQWLDSTKIRWQREWKEAEEPRIVILLGGYSDRSAEQQEQIENAISFLRVIRQVDCITCDRPSGFFAFVKSLQRMTLAISKVPYVKPTTLVECLPKFHPAEQLESRQEIAHDTWYRMLCCIPQMSPDRASALVQHYPSIRSLWLAYQDESTTKTEKEHLIADLLEPGRCLANLSTQIFEIMTSTNPAKWIH